MSSTEVAELYTLIRNLTKEVNELAVAVARLEAQFALRRECPEPGLCLDLRDRVESLQIDRAKVQGVGLAAKAIWAFIGAGGVGVVVAIVQLLSHLK